MSNYRVEIRGLESLQRTLGSLKAAVSPGEVATAAGREIAVNYMPKLFKTGGFGSWEALKLRPGKPLDDTGWLKTSWSHRKTDDATVEVSTTRPFAAVHNEGMTIFAKPGKVMMIPNPNYWSGPDRRNMTISQLYARIKGRQKYARLKGGKRGAAAMAKLTDKDNPPFFFAKKVTIPKRSMTELRPEMVEAAMNAVKKMIQDALKKANG
jgi:phage gpG-like protein